MATVGAASFVFSLTLAVKRVIKGKEVSVCTKLTTVNGRFFVLATETQGKVVCALHAHM